jgi:hypothetical protein
MATEAYEAEMFSSRLDDAGQPMEAGLQPVQKRSIDAPTAALKARRARKPQVETAPRAETTPAPKRKRRTKAELAAAAAGMAGAAAAVVATVAVTKRRRGAKPETRGEAAPEPAADAALRRPRRSRSGATLLKRTSRLWAWRATQRPALFPIHPRIDRLTSPQACCLILARIRCLTQP